MRSGAADEALSNFDGGRYQRRQLGKRLDCRQKPLINR